MRRDIGSRSGAARMRAAERRARSAQGERAERRRTKERSVQGQPRPGGHGSSTGRTALIRPRWLITELLRSEGPAR